MRAAPIVTSTEHTTRQTVTVAVVASVSGWLFGYGTGVIAGVLPAIGRQFGLSSVEQGALVAITLLSAGGAAPLGARVADRFGRRTAMLVISALFLVGTVGASLAPNYLMLLLSRLVVGAAVGSASFIGPAYVAEVSPDRTRGALTVTNQLMITIGILSAMLITLGFIDSGNWRAAFAVGGVPAAAMIVGLLKLPESPRWLHDRGQVVEAQNVAMHMGLNLEKHASAATHTVRTRELLDQRHRRRFWLGITLSVVVHLTGLNVAVYYVPTILQQSGFTPSAASLGSVVVAMGNVVITVVAMVVVDRLGRRPLFIGGLVAMAVGAALLSGQFFTGSDGSPLSVVILACFLAAGAIGPAGVFWLYVVEIYPQRIRAMALSFVTLAHWMADTLVAFTFLPLVAATSLGFAFAVYGTLTIVAATYCLVSMPETRAQKMGGHDGEGITSSWNTNRTPSRYPARHRTRA